MTAPRRSAPPARTRPELEKHVERRGDDLMTALGFRVIRFSQSRATRQTEGIPDRLYVHRALRLALWWEAKRPGGRQRDGQRAFQLDAEACGQTYLLGTDAALIAWVQDRAGPYQRALSTPRLSPLSPLAVCAGDPDPSEATR